MPLLELVPNLSEGRDPDVIHAVADCFRRPDVHLLHVDTSRGAHRTVFTVVGEAEDLVEAAVSAAQVAAERIDLRAHRGEHARMGALDVVPFVPLDSLRADGGTLVDAFSAARDAGDRVGAWGIPVYFYGEAASRPHRRLLHEVRRDGFEGLAARIAYDPPDRGPERPHPTAGASAIGARTLLIAWNVSLGTRDVRVAQAIAREIREFSSVSRGPDGRVTHARPGQFRGVRAVGWWAEDFDCAQVSCNLTDWHTSPPHAVYAAIRARAHAMGVPVLGSELIGCIPEAALRAAALADGVTGDDAALARAGIAALGLDRVKAFDPDVNILEWSIARALGGGE